MKIIKQTILLVIIGLSFCSCKDLFGDDEHDKRVVFGLENKDETVFSKIELFTKKDSSGTLKYGYFASMIDSNYTNDVLPTKELPSLGIPFRNLKGLDNGTFEIRATKPDSSKLIKEFGFINGDQTQKKFYLELTNDQITVK
ncbi:hypothetical protein [Dyadobacter fanqingshengii]|uniref:Uncharacterized protein n=1 Tax=Dyadobacter fanqingshengii TaxID=2906443 RepID=A0A9X1PBS8_9BACT|nr:hypothetical protein [Dyadobacter fanqingshengii]MCF0040377.1 hypothetical protein [Dyadobacter fanqingshengii]USJ37880.1 hypothetical protein NFI81_08850 [Dyadobacter fanqingshengii]